jgi:hypothetical protein
MIRRGFRFVGTAGDAVLLAAAAAEALAGVLKETTGI